MDTRNRRTAATSALTPAWAPLAVLALVLTLSACAGEDDQAVDSAGAPAATSTAAPDPSYSAVDGQPALPIGEERTEVGMVLDTGDGAQLCLGAVTKSLPPQCSGIPLTGWDWDANPEHERRGEARWGTFSVTGTFDGEQFAVSDSAPGASAHLPGGE